MILLDTSALIDSLTGSQRLGPALRSALARGRRMRIPTPVLFEWPRSPQAARVSATGSFVPVRRGRAVRSLRGASSGRAVPFRQTPKIARSRSRDRGIRDYARCGTLDPGPERHRGHTRLTHPCSALRSGRSPESSKSRPGAWVTAPHLCLVRSKETSSLLADHYLMPSLHWNVLILALFRGVGIYGPGHRSY